MMLQPHYNRAVLVSQLLQCLLLSSPELMQYQNLVYQEAKYQEVIEQDKPLGGWRAAG